MGNKKILNWESEEHKNLQDNLREYLMSAPQLFVTYLAWETVLGKKVTEYSKADYEVLLGFITWLKNKEVIEMSKHGVIMKEFKDNSSALELLPILEYVDEKYCIFYDGVIDGLTYPIELKGLQLWATYLSEFKDRFTAEYENIVKGLSDEVLKELLREIENRKDRDENLYYKLASMNIEEVIDSGDIL